MRQLERTVYSNAILAGRVRRDECCVILRETRGTAQVRFEDGQTAIIPRYQLRAPKPKVALLQASQGEKV